MKDSWGINTDVNICFTNYEMIKTWEKHMWQKHTDGIVWIKIAFVKWIHKTCLISHVLEAALFWDVSVSFWFFLLIIIRELDSVIRIGKWEEITTSSLQTEDGNWATTKKT